MVYEMTEKKFSIEEIKFWLKGCRLQKIAPGQSVKFALAEVIYCDESNQALDLAISQIDDPEDGIDADLTRETEMNKKSKLVQIAKQVATDAHIGQKRTSGEDYINHCERVAKVVAAQSNYSYIDTAAAWLHDVLEDTIVTENMLREVFGNEITDIVVLLTRTKNQTYYQFITSLVESKNVSAMSIKLIDLKDNMSDSKEGSRLDKYRFAYMMILDSMQKVENKT